MNESLDYPFTNAPGEATYTVVLQSDANQRALIKWLRSPLPMSLNHINCYLLRDGDGWCAVDTGMNGEASKKHWLNIIEGELEGLPISRVIVTHHHPDHVGLAGWLCDSHQAPLYMSEKEYFYTLAFNAPIRKQPYWEVETYFNRCGISQSDRKALLADQDYNHLVTEVPSSLHQLSDGGHLQIGDHQWEIISTRGHCPEHICLYCKQLDILISGDQVLPKITSNVSVSPSIPNDNPLKNWLEAHDIVKERVPDSVLVLPAHQLPFKGLHKRLQQVVEHHEHRLDELEKLCIKPHTAQELTYELFDRKLEPFQNFLAVGECIAHLHYLMYQNRIEQTQEGEHFIYRQANN